VRKVIFLFNSISESTSLQIWVYHFCKTRQRKRKMEHLLNRIQTKSTTMYKQIQNQKVKLTKKNEVKMKQHSSPQTPLSQDYP